MASMPSVVFSNTISSPTFEKKNNSLDKGLDPFSLDVRKGLWLIKNVNEKVESAAYVPLLQKCVKNNSVSDVEMIHGHIIKTGANQDSFLMTFLVNTYVKFGEMESARKVFDKMSVRNSVTWTSIISGYIQDSQPEIAIRVFLEMLEFGVYPKSLALGMILNACSLLSDLNMAKQVHGYAVKYGVEHDTSIGNVLCSLYSKFGILDCAIRAFQRIEEKNVISWTSVINSCGDNGDSINALGFFIDMLCDGVEPNEFTLSCVLSSCTVMEAIRFGSQVYSLSIKLGYGSNTRVKNSLIYLFLRCGWIMEAKKLFEGMETNRLITWNAMIAGLAQMSDLSEDVFSTHSSASEALQLFARLNRSGIKPDLYTFSSVLNLCSILVALEQGEQIHAQVIKSGSLHDVVIKTALLNMYSKCGLIERASRAFVEMSTRTLISWTSMIAAYSLHGCSKQALQLFEDMRFVGVRPNNVTFTAVLLACSHAGMFEEAFEYFNMMRNEYKINPTQDHYSCLISLYVRLGRIEEAFEFIKKMDFQLNEYTWSLLIAGCRNQGKLEQGFYAAEQLLNLNPKNPESYTMLFNMYISEGRLEEALRVKKLMEEKNIKEITDWSWINIREKTLSFKTDIKLHSSYQKLGEFLIELHEKVKSLGCESKTGYYHSEKLAVAFGLLNSPCAATVRVIKSVCMCTDCHSFLKSVSTLTGREILVRDSKRMHKFVNGECSCRDFPVLEIP